MRRKRIGLDDAEAAIGLVEDAMGIVEIYARLHARESAYRMFRLTSSKDELLQVISGLDDPTPERPRQLYFDFNEGLR